MKCLGKSERYERMMDLTVEIDGNIGTLEEALTLLKPWTEIASTIVTGWVHLLI